MDNYHLTKKGEDWQLKKEGAERATLKAETKQQALEQARKFMGDHGGSMKVHRGDGVIQTEHTYPRSADPRKSKG